MPPGRRNNNLKSLGHLYKTSLPSLTELFPDWSQDDLLFVMDECQGDLHVAITRISEGIIYHPLLFQNNILQHYLGNANQWGQVKSKKPKVKKPFIKGGMYPCTFFIYILLIFFSNRLYTRC